MIRDKLFGQETAQRILLSQMASRRLSHAYLFTGPQGVGKRAAARAFAMAINCSRRDGACSCERCLLVPGQSHPDVRMVAPDNGSIKLEQVQAVIAEAALTPNQGPYRVFVIEEAERLTREAGNALLLTLEEPNPLVIFILTASSPLLPTIQSRCQVVQFHRRTPQGPATVDLGVVLALVQRVMQLPPKSRVALFSEIEALPGGTSLFLSTLLDLLRDLLMLSIGRHEGLFLDRSTVEQFSSLFPADADHLASLCRQLIDAQRMHAANVNRRALLEHLLFSL
ncbi:MAG: hypothetical protein ACOX2K_10055 [Bacillota bacterium]|jgi:DNA polymerase III delta' subunit